MVSSTTRGAMRFSATIRASFACADGTVPASRPTAMAVPTTNRRRTAPTPSRAPAMRELYAACAGRAPPLAAGAVYAAGVADGCARDRIAHTDGIDNMTALVISMV